MCCRREERHGNKIAVSGLPAVGNICRNRCEYCGLRAPYHRLSRYRLGFEEISRSLDGIREQGISRLFLISGEDPGADVDMLCRAVSFATESGFRERALLRLHLPGVLITAGHPRLDAIDRMLDELGLARE